MKCQVASKSDQLHRSDGINKIPARVGVFCRLMITPLRVRRDEALLLLAKISKPDVVELPANSQRLV